MSSPLTASLLYNLVQCPKRIDLDLHGDRSGRDVVSPFVQMLWDRGALYEANVVRGLSEEFVDLSSAEEDEKERLTLEALKRGDRLIYSGRITADDLVGIPDLLRRDSTGYVPVDIKSGGGEESGGEDDDGKPKLHYAVQLALYVDILERLELSAGRYGIIWDVHGREVQYDLDAPRGPRTPGTLWDEYQTKRAQARSIIATPGSVKGALASSCGLCHWHTACGRELVEADDLTRIPALGRSIRDAMADRIATVAELAAINPDGFVTEKNKTVFNRVSAERLRLFHDRAKLLSGKGQPYLRAPLQLPMSSVELFFDIEVDPMRDLTYLHGIVERRGGQGGAERFVYFFAEDETKEAERKAFAEAVAYLASDGAATIWYYSKYERTIYRKLQQRYPDVCGPEVIEALFDPGRAVDLYNDVVTKATEWPTHNHSIKTLAKYLGFSWRDTNPSGAASIEWFDRWVRERDPAVRQRILDYNEDDCRATRVLLDGIRGLAGSQPTAPLVPA